MRTAYWRIAGSLALACFLLAGAAPAYGAKRGLPFEVRQAVKKAFPNATIRSYGRETENGVRFYEVNLRQNGLKIEVEVDKYGGIGEIERRISLAEAPKDLVKALSKVADNPRRMRIERHERWGRARNGRFVGLAAPRVFYEVKLYVNGRRREVKWMPMKQRVLPREVTRAIEAIFPRAVITDAEKEHEDGVPLYEVVLTQDGRDMEVKVSAEGVVIEIAARIRFRDLPKPVASAVTKAARGGKVVKVEKLDVRALARSGGFVKLDEPLTLYEVKYAPPMGKPKVEVVFSSAGTKMETETDVPLRNIPATVIRAVAKTARGARAVSAEKEVVYALLKSNRIVRLERPRVTYELELVRNGMEAEIEVAEDGTIVKRPQWQAIERENFEDDEDDDD